MYKSFVTAILTSVLKGQALDDVPIMRWQEEDLELRVSFICRHRKNVGQFFYDMINRWLIPGKNLDIVLHFSTLYEEKGKLYSVSQLILELDTVEDFTYAKRNSPFLEKEILLGARSFYHAGKILEMKGLNVGDKTSLIQEKIAKFVRRFPKKFDYDIFSYMQQFLIAAKDSFKAIHQPSEISRMIFTLYHFRKILGEKRVQNGARRHLCLKFRPTFLNTPFGQKEILAVFGGLSFLKPHELFEQRHFLSALAPFIPGAKIVPGSYYAIEHEGEKVQAFYLELEKEGVFSHKEIAYLKRALSSEILNRVEQLVPPIFMPRNEEEVMRNILILSEQLKYARDLPQMTIAFDRQTDASLAFTVIIVRLTPPGSLSVKELFQKSALASSLLFDRVKVVGRLRKKIPKEASVIRVQLNAEQFMRDDYSVDLFAARLHLLEAIQGAIGEVRDYNGGMISKQGENFARLKEALGKTSIKHGLLLQNFFHSIFPVHFSATLDPQLLKILFTQLLKAVEASKETVLFLGKRASDYLFIIAKFQEDAFQKRVLNQVEGLKIPSSELLSIQMQIFDTSYLGFIYLNPSKQAQEAFLGAIPEEMEFVL